MRILLFLCLAIFLAACSTNNESGQEDQATPEQNEEQKLYDEAIEAHDLVMPKYSVIQRTQITLEDYLEANEVDEALSNRIELANDNMEAANDGMMEWMAKISPVSKLRETKSHAEIIAFWQEMTKEINTVKQQMEESLATGQALITELEPVSN